MSRPTLCALPGNDAFRRRLQARLDWPALRLQCRRFPDGESYVRFMGDPAGADLALVCTLDRPDEKVQTLLFAAATARELGAASVGLVAPYLAYMRQDRRFQDGEAVTSALFARQLSAAFDWLVTVDAHLHRRRSLSEIYAIPARDVSAAAGVAAWIREHVERPLVVGPDAESERWAAAVGAAAGAPHLALRKHRSGDRDVRITAPALDRWRGHTPVLVDDIISTARTMAGAARQFTAQDFAPAICIGVHGVFTADALQVLRDAGVARILTANTIPHETNAIDVSDAVAEAAREQLGAFEEQAG
jgi:ribose-phosphate pyrophosphokinase